MTEYRIDDNFDLIGGFWKYGSPNDVFTGTMTARKGVVKILTAPVYVDLDAATSRVSMEEMFKQSDLEQIPSICGFTADNRCTLFNSTVFDGGGLINLPTQQKISAKRYSPARTVMGLHVESSDADVIDEAAFYFTKIHHLYPIPWNTHMGEENTTYSVPSNTREIFRFRSAEIDAEVVCEVFSRGNTKIKKRVWIKSAQRIRIISQSKHSVDSLTAIAFRLENFFTLFLGTSVGLKQVQLFQGNDGGWVVQKMRRRNEKIDRQTWIRCPFETVASALEIWLAVPEDKRPVELTLLGMMRKSTVFDETEFLSLAQALEGFGRIRFGAGRGRPGKFKTLIEQTYDLLSLDFAKNLIGERSLFVKKIIQTRDYYTHLGNPKGTSATKTPKELFLFNKRIHAFLRCVMLIDLGVSEEYLKEPILYLANRWR